MSDEAEERLVDTDGDIDRQRPPGIERARSRGAATAPTP
jgi:hypothetical protein